MIKKIKTDQEAVDMLKALEHYISNDPTDNVNIRTPAEIVFTPDNGIVNRNQVLRWSRETWIVGHLAPYTHSVCLLTPCERNDLKPGDVVFMANNDKPDFFSLSNYYVILNDRDAVHWETDEVRIIDYSFNDHYRVEIK